jgi:hypothetical protein
MAPSLEEGKANWKANNEVKRLSLYLTLGKRKVLKGESQTVVLVVVRDKIKVESEFVEND